MLLKESVENASKNVERTHPVWNFMYDFEIIDIAARKLGLNSKYINSRTVTTGIVLSQLAYKYGKSWLENRKKYKTISIQDGRSELFRPIMFYLIHKENFFDNVHIVDGSKIENDDNDKAGLGTASSERKGYGHRGFENINDEITRIQIPDSFEKKLTYDGISIHITREIVKTNVYNNILIDEILHLRFKLKDSRKIFKDWIREVIDFYAEHYLTKNVRLFKNNRDWWAESNNSISRPWESVILPDDKKQKIWDDLQRYISRRKFYNDKGIPYKRTHLFEGISGTGKSSMIQALASRLKRDVYYLSSSPTMTNDDLINLFSNISENSILVIEEVDGWFDGRNKTEDDNHVTYGTFINCLDGILSGNDIITFMTTNHIEKLDEALLRDGRVDLKIKFDYMSEHEIINMIEYLYDINELEYTNADMILDYFSGKKIKHSELQNIILECENIQNFLTYIKSQ